MRAVVPEERKEEGRVGLVAGAPEHQASRDHELGEPAEEEGGGGGQVHPARQQRAACTASLHPAQCRACLHSVCSAGSSKQKDKRLRPCRMRGVAASRQAGGSARRPGLHLGTHVPAARPRRLHQGRTATGRWAAGRQASSPAARGGCPAVVDRPELQLELAGAGELRDDLQDRAGAGGAGGGGQAGTWARLSLGLTCKARHVERLQRSASIAGMPRACHSR